jgi:hypothetical protein
MSKSRNINPQYYLIAIVFTFSTLFVSAQTPILPINSYGVWDRSNAFNISVDTAYSYLRGISADVFWKDVQAIDSSHYDWSAIQGVLQTAYTNNQMVNISVGVGPDAPSWIYSNGVPAVITDDTQHPGWTQYPYYVDSDYKRYYFKLIDSLGVFLRTLPANLFSSIAYIQVKTGCTGDEVAYKGNPLDTSFKISNADWRTFRLSTFEKFRVTFNTGSNNTKVGLLFNNIDPIDQPNEWQWVLTNITYGFGTKGGAYGRGHHLSDELTFKSTWTPYLVNPQGQQLFSAAEQDQTWKGPVYQINVPLGFYWGARSGLNTGLSVWLVTQSALNEAHVKPELHNIFRMFNKYAGQIYPTTVNAAYTIFHEGLNSANTTKFPVATFGNASQSNQARYTAICSAYAARGAKMDDVFAATKGQVYQRANQTGYNDAGWDIEEGNYERWITQINPDSTSIGLFRIRGTIDSSSSMYDRFARSFQNSSGRNAMYFKFHQNLFSLKVPDSLTFKITWLDKTQNSTWAFKYYNSNGLQTALSVTGIGDNQWKTINVVLHNPLINQNGILGSDFMLVNTDGVDDIFHGIEVDITRGGNVLPVNLSFFNVVANGNQQVALNWNTSTEQNTKLFEIQRSFDGSNFETISKVLAGKTNYSFNDNQLTITTDKLTIYYRLQIVDKNGSYTFSPIKRIQLNSKQQAINIYPNPAKEFINVEAKSIKQVSVIDNLGRVVLTRNFDADIMNCSINISLLQKGFYAVQVIDKNGNVSVSPLLVFFNNN